MRRWILLIPAVALLPSPARGVAWAFSDIPEQIVAEVVNDTLENAKKSLNAGDTSNWKQIKAYGDKLAAGDYTGILNDAFGSLVSGKPTRASSSSWSLRRPPARSNFSSWLSRQ